MNSYISRRQFRSVRYFVVALLFALLAASCCPPALLERAPKKVAKATAQFEKNKGATDK